jgi:LysM repeat protein
VKKLFIILLFSIFAFLSNAQVQVEKSNVVETINGKKYYVHIVKQGQTMYSISNAYNVKVEEIESANPESKQGLKPQMILKIPKFSGEQNQDDKEQPDIDEGEPNKGMIKHKVVKGETLYSLSRKYNTTVEAIKNANPQMGEYPKLGDVISIPIAAHKEEPEAEPKAEPEVQDVNKDSFILHKVERKETIYGITRQYNISEADLLKHNPDLADGLKKGMQLKIPVEVLEAVKVIDNEVADDVAKVSDDEITSHNCDSMPIKRSYRIAMMLPLYLNYLDDIEILPFQEQNISDYKSLEFIQFYEGAMLAIDSLEEQGLHAKVHVYDTRNDSARIAKIANSDLFNQMDLSIGPFYGDKSSCLDKMMDDSEIKVICPFSNVNHVEGKKGMIFKLQPSLYSHFYNVFNYIIDSFPKHNILIVHNNKPGDSAMIVKLKTTYGNAARSLGTSAANAFVVDYDSLGFGGLTQKLVKDKPNFIFTLIQGEVFLTRYTILLSKLTDDYNINLVGSRNWHKYDGIETINLEKLNLHTFSDFNIDYNDKDVKSFVRAFRAKYKTEPDELAFRGFDITYYFLSAMMNYGNHFEHCLHKVDVNTMHTVFKFQKLSPTIFENTFSNVVKYENYRMVNKKKLPVLEPMIQEEGEEPMEEKSTE